MSKTVSKGDAERSNRALGSPIWCSKNPVQDLKTQLDRKYKGREEALRQLMTRDRGKLNVDFVSEFYKYFYINEPCICREIILDKSTSFVFEFKRWFGAGKVGQAGTFLDKTQNKLLILKKIAPPSGDFGKYVQTFLEGDPTAKRYLSLRVSDYNHKSFDQLNMTLRKNRWKERGTRATKDINVSVFSDNFSNQSIQHLILNEILGDNAHYIYQYDAFYCENGGYNITEFADKGDLSEFLEKTDPRSITDNFLVDILRQVLEPLAILKNPLYGFIHGDLKCRNVFVKEGPNHRPIYQIADYDKSSITWHGIRFYNGTGDYRLFNIPFPLQGQHSRDPYYVLTGESWFSTLWNKIPLQIYIMHSPLGFYPMHDIYTFFYSLMMEPPVWEYVKRLENYKDQRRQHGNSEFLYLWGLLWFSDQYTGIMKHIKREHEKLSKIRESFGERSREYREKIAKMRSITQINNTFSNEKWKLKRNVNLFGELGLRVGESPSFTEGKPHLTISSDRHICISPCVWDYNRDWKGKTCETNVFSKTNVLTLGKILWNWDHCTG